MTHVIYLELAIYLAIFISASVMSLGMGVLYFTLDRRVRSQFQREFGYSDPNLAILRVATYARYVVFPRMVSQDKHVIMNYQNFDFRGFATPLERTVCYFTIYSFFTFAVLAIGVNIADFLGYISLDDVYVA